MRDLVDEPLIDHSDLVNRAVGNALPECLRDDPDPLIIDDRKAFKEVFLGKTGKIVARKAVDMLLQRADCLHHCTFKIVADAHDFAGRLHLRGERALRRDEFVERKTRELDDAVVERRLEARVGLAGDGVFDLVQRIAEGNLGCDLCDRIAGCL